MTMMAAPLGWGNMDDGWRKGPWTPEEDRLLMEYVRLHGEGRWNSVARVAGLKRNGKSSRLRWVNYLRPDLKKGQITPQEEKVIVELHAKWGNRWSTIARSLPGRTDNEIKNYWRTHFKKNGKSNQIIDKVKKRALKRQEQKQQFQQLQQEQQRQQQQQQQFDLKKLMAQLELDDYRVHPLQASTATAFYPTANEQFPSNIFPSDAYPPEAALSEESLLGGLWNLDDLSTSSNNMCTNRKAMDGENQVLPAFYYTGYFN